MKACPRCGSGMRPQFAHLTTATSCTAVFAGDECVNEACRRDEAAARRADQARRDEEAIASAIEKGVINP